MRWTSSVILLACGPLVLAACPGTLDEPERFRVDSGATLAPPLDAGPLDCNTAIPALLSGTCAAAGCHAAGANAAGSLDLASGDVRTRIRNVPSTGDPKYLLINTTTPEQSALYLKTAESPPFGLQMPPAPAAPLDTGMRACLLTWIKATPAGGPSGDGGGVTDAGGD